MQYTRIFTGADQQSHFEIKELTLLAADVGTITAAIAVDNVFFGEMTDQDKLDWHNPPRSQYLIMLQGAIEIELGDGSKKIFKEGDIVLADDLSGKGHRTKAVTKGNLKYLVIPLK